MMPVRDRTYVGDPSKGRPAGWPACSRPQPPRDDARTLWDGRYRPGDRAVRARHDNWDRGLSVCFPIAVEGDDTRPAPLDIALRLEPAARGIVGDPLQVMVTATDPEGREIRLPDRLPLIIMALSSGWRATVIAQRSPDGKLVAEVDPLPPGLYPVILAGMSPAGLRVAPAMLKVGSP